MEITLNPFTNRGVITDPSNFFGRGAEIEELVARLRAMQSTSIIGERRIGKSSLLYHLAQTGAQRLNDEGYLLAYFSVQDAHFHTANGFYQAILQRLGLAAEVIKDDHKPNRNLIAFTDELEKLTQTGRRVVLCLNEFETLFKHPAEFGEDFFDHFRSQLEMRRFAFVTATRRKLQDLCLEGRLTSPFYNIFTNIELGEFTEDETMGFIAAHDEQVRFTADELGFIHTYFQTHPLKLQILCDWLLKNRVRQLSKDALIQEIEKEYGNFFPGMKENLRRAKRWLSLDSFNKLLATLKTGRDLISGK